MPSLNWIGKDAVVKHHQDVPHRLLEPVSALSCGNNAGSGNLIVQGDNLPPFAGPKTVYAAACRLGAPRLQREQVAFKQTPYALAV